jgi:hypothetical protein
MYLLAPLIQRRSVANKRTLPVDRHSPTDCDGGWFYVNSGSITVVADVPAGRQLCTVNRRQLLAALKLMTKRASDRERNMVDDKELAAIIARAIFEAGTWNGVEASRIQFMIGRNPERAVAGFAEVPLADLIEGVLAKHCNPLPPYQGRPADTPGEPN